MRFLKKDEIAAYDFICFINKDTVDWILGATARAIISRATGRTKIMEHGKKAPASAAYFYTNWYSYVKDFHNKKLPPQGLKLVFFTHSRATPLPEDIIIKAFNNADKIIFMNSIAMAEYIRKGVDAQKAVFICGGAADPQFFRPHKRDGKGTIGFCSAYYERKNPQLILDLIKALPKRQFLFLGRNWQQFQHFAEMKSLPNFTYIEDKYKNYPDYYNQMDAFISPSFLEGGPIPLVEAMMSNIFPIASATGFAPDIIEHGKNGFLFDPNKPDLQNLCALVEKALMDTKTDIRATTSKLTWDNFAANVLKLSKSNG